MVEQRVVGDGWWNGGWLGRPLINGHPGRSRPPIKVEAYLFPFVSFVPSVPSRQNPSPPTFEIRLHLPSPLEEEKWGSKGLKNLTV